MEPDGAPRLEAADLHQVAELVHEPEAAAAGLSGQRPLAAGERLVEPARVRDLADQRVRLAPDAQLSSSAAVAHRVRRQLVDGEDEVGRSRRAEARLVRRPTDQPAERLERAVAEVELERRLRRLGQRFREWGAASAEAVAVGDLAP